MIKFLFARVLIMRYRFISIGSGLIRRLRALLVYLLSGVRFKKVGDHCKLKGSKIYVGNHVGIGDFCWIEAVEQYNGQYFSPIIKIGEKIAMSDFVHISAIKYISIGSGTLIGSKVYIGDHSHGHYKDIKICEQEKDIIPSLRPLADEKEIIIGKNCWIGDGAVVLAGTEIGDNCVIGANSVLKGNFPANSLIAGVPAKLIKKR